MQEVRQQEMEQDEQWEKERLADVAAITVIETIDIQDATHHPEIVSGRIKIGEQTKASIAN